VLYYLYTFYSNSHIRCTIFLFPFFLFLSKNRIYIISVFTLLRVSCYVTSYAFRGLRLKSTRVLSPVSQGVSDDIKFKAPRRISRVPKTKRHRVSLPHAHYEHNGYNRTSNIHYSCADIDFRSEPVESRVLNKAA